jgi:amino acid permease
MICTICGNSINFLREHAIPTTDGGHVHLICAERQAHAASKQRTLQATISAGLLGTLLILAIVVRLEVGTCMMLTALLVIMHILCNRRWWHYKVQSARLWWRLRA